MLSDISELIIAFGLEVTFNYIYIKLRYKYMYEVQVSFITYLSLIIIHVAEL